MAEETRKNIVLRVDPAFHQKIKIHVTMQNTTLQDYIVGLIEKDMLDNDMSHKEMLKLRA